MFPFVTELFVFPAFPVFPVFPVFPWFFEGKWDWAVFLGLKLELEDLLESYVIGIGLSEWNLSLNS